MFQAGASGHSSGAIPNLNRVVGLMEALSAGNTSCALRVSNNPNCALVQNYVRSHGATPPGTTQNNG